MKQLFGKNVLLIAPRFFGYETEIQKVLEQRGANVDWLVDRPFDKPWQIAATRLCPGLVLPLATQYTRNILGTLEATHYDLIFAVNTVTLTPEIMRILRSSYPTAKAVLYMWDSMENRRHVEDILPYFDQAFSFDPHSTRDYGMTFRPLFFLDDYRQTSMPEVAYDLSFIGTIHADRYAIINQLKATLPPNINCFWYLYLQAEWVYWAFRVLKPSMRYAKKSEFRFRPLEKKAVRKVFSQTLAVVDIEHPNQRGLTMRTFEALGAGKKLITTNRNILEYDFYNENNICVIDRNTPRIPDEFLASPYQPLPTDLYEKYSIWAWLDEVIGTEAAV
jgi:hypothetical protein